MKLLLMLLMSTQAFAYNVTLSWDADADTNITGYNIYEQIGQTGTFQLMVSLPASQLSEPISDLNANLLYTFYVTATLNSFESAPSNQVTYIASPALTMVNTGNNTAQINMIVNPGAQYELDQSPDLVTWTAINTFTATTDQFQYSVPTTAAQMFFRLKTL